MVLRLMLMASWLAFVAACSEQIGEEAALPEAPPAETGPASETEAEPFELPARPATVRSEARIDWQTARTDLALTPGTVMPEGFQIQSGEQAPPVPVLLPTGLATTAGTNGGAHFVPLPDGYLATYPGVDYDITVSGTNEVFDAAPGLGDGIAELSYVSTVDGAMVSFTRYGAGYVVEFVCKGTSGADGGACISEDVATQLAQSLIIAGSR
jgi:hypothetical protein